MKSAFYFTLKDFFVLKIFKCFSWIFGHVGKRFNYKDKVNFKIYDVATWETIAINILSNISKSKDNQAIKFDQLIELKNHTQKVVEKLLPDPFLKDQNWAYLWINSLKFYTVCFYCMSSCELSKFIETKLQTTCFYLI